MKKKSFTECWDSSDAIMMEGALGERLKREYHLSFDEHVSMAGLIYRLQGQEALYRIWQEYITVAETYNLPILLTTPTRRADRKRIASSGFSAKIIADNMKFLKNIAESEQHISVYAGGMLGSYGDAYTGKDALTDSDEARDFHRYAAQRFAQAGADFLYAALMPTLPEMIGMAYALAETGIPYIISFTIQADGCLIDHTPIADAIAAIDGLVSPAPVCYMTNCVHPGIVMQALLQPCNQADIIHRRFLGIQANTSALSYAELDHAADLHSSDPETLADDIMKLRSIVPLRIFGGCCGTDGRHMKAIAERIAE